MLAVAIGRFFSFYNQVFISFYCRCTKKSSRDQYPSTYPWSGKVKYFQVKYWKIELLPQPVSGAVAVCTNLLLPGSWLNLQTFSHVTPLLMQLHYLLVYFTVHFKTQYLTCRAPHGLSPVYIHGPKSPPGPWGPVIKASLYSQLQNWNLTFLLQF